MTPEAVLEWLAATGSAEGLASLTRYGIPNDRAFGVPMGVMQQQAKRIGKDHGLALALWKHGAYEARTMAVYLAEEANLTSEQADAWCATFDNWGICDTACFHLFDRTPFAWDKVAAWSPDPREFVRRTGFALIWSLTVHDKRAADSAFTDTFDLFRKVANDDRLYVRKGVDMALRAIGKRNNALNRAAREFADELASNANRNSRWLGTHARRELESAGVMSRLKGRR